MRLFKQKRPLIDYIYEQEEHENVWQIYREEGMTLVRNSGQPFGFDWDFAEGYAYAKAECWRFAHPRDHSMTLGIFNDK